MKVNEALTQIGNAELPTAEQLIEVAQVFATIAWVTVIAVLVSVALVSIWVRWKDRKR